MDKRPILVTGATGYIGGRLVPQLLARGERVRCLVRDPNRLRGRDWEGRVEVAAGDVLDRDSLGPALDGCRAGYYLIHSMAGGERAFRDRDLAAARNFADAAAGAGLERIVYLGGLGCRHDHASAHLSSRHEVGDILHEGAVPTTELRAAMIIGSGSASFEMMRALVRRLPVMVCPRWVTNRTQPIAIRNVLDYLIGVLDHPEAAGRTFDIGGPDVLTYKQMMMRFAAILGKRRHMIVVPVLTPRLSAYWANMVTPVPAGVAFPLIEGLRVETICEDDAIRRVVPLDLIGFDDAVRRALAREEAHDVETRWTNASLRLRRSLGRTAFDPAAFPLRDVQTVECDAPAEALYDRVRRIGGEVGYYYADALWEIRGAMDRMIGGVGLRRGRRDPARLVPGDALDFWRVEDVIPGERLLLHAEMRVPGDAWLEFRVRSLPDGRAELTQTAYFRPSPFWGRLYWYAIYPVHWLIFRGMARNIARAAERQVRAEPVSSR